MRSRQLRASKYWGKRKTHRQLWQGCGAKGCGDAQRNWLTVRQKVDTAECRAASCCISYNNLLPILVQALPRQVRVKSSRRLRRVGKARRRRAHLFIANRATWKLPGESRRVRDWMRCIKSWMRGCLASSRPACSWELCRSAKMISRLG